MRCRILLLSVFCFVFASKGIAQAPLFESNDLVTITISGNLHELWKDRGNDPQYHVVTVSYQEGKDIISIPAEIKARGHFRKMKENCSYPPLQLNFTDAPASTSLFAGQGKLKLVTPCQGEKFVVREYLVYQLYNLISARSFKARLVKVIFRDTEKNKSTQPQFCFFLEDEDQMAARTGMIPMEKQLIKPEYTQKPEFLNMAVFEYLIGNTDWSVQYRQNVKLFAIDSTRPPVPVPYDFDHAGIVGAPYAKPAEQLLLSSVRERRYRGYCLEDLKELDETFALFREKEKDLQAVYANCPYLEDGFKKSTNRYISDFFKTINNPGLIAFDFGYPCRKNGTGNVVIMGLDKN